MSITVNNPSYDRVYTIHAWRDNNIRLVFTQGEGVTNVGNEEESITANHVKAPRFQLRDEHGVINLSDCSGGVVLAITRPDGSTDLLACNVTNDEAANGIISCPITASATSIAGDAVGEVRVYSSNGIIKFFGIHVHVHKGVSDDAAAQATLYSAFISALQKLGMLDAGIVDPILLDTQIVENGTNPVASGILYNELAKKADFDNTQDNIDNCIEPYTFYKININTNDNPEYALVISVNDTSDTVTQFALTEKGRLLFRQKSNNTWTGSFAELIYGEIELYDGDIISESLSSAGAINCILFGGNDNNKYRTGLGTLSKKDKNTVYHMEIFFEDVSLTGSSKVSFRERTGNSVKNYPDNWKISTDPTGKTFIYDYSMSSDAGVSDNNTMFYMALNCAAEQQTVHVRITERIPIKNYAYSKKETDILLEGKANKADSLNGYGIEDAYTKEEVKNLMDIRTGTSEQEITLFDSEIISTKKQSDNDNQDDNNINSVTKYIDGSQDNDVRFYIANSSQGAQLTLKSGQKYWFLVNCKEASLKNSNSIRLYHRVGDSVETLRIVPLSEIREYPNNTVVFEYTVPSGEPMSNLNLRFNWAADADDSTAGTHSVSLTVKTIEYVSNNPNENTEGLPSYYKDEIERVTKDVLDTANYNDVVFGVYTDLHFGNLGLNTDADAQRWNAIKAMRRLADEAPLDFVLQGGDLLTQNKYDNDTYILNRSQTAFSGCRVPVYTSKGDHDSSQYDKNNPNEKQITKSDFLKRTAPYMPKAVRSSEYPNNYYFDLPEKKTRVVNIDTGTVEAGQGGKGADYSTWTEEVFFNWLLNEVLTDEIKNGWKIIFFSHAPCDYEWQLGFLEYQRKKAYENLRVKAAKEGSGYIYDPNVKFDLSPESTLPEKAYNFQSSRVARGYQLILNDLFEAINNAGEFSALGKTLKKYTLSRNSTTGIIEGATNTNVNVSDGVYAISGIDLPDDDELYTKDFDGWTSKVKMILSGHCHFDRLNNKTLIPNGDNYELGFTSYAIAYTAAAAKSGLTSGKLTKYPPNTDESGIGMSYCNCCFGNDYSDSNPSASGESISTAAWSNIKERNYGDVSEQLMDVWIVGDTYVKRVRFGAGAGSPLFSASVDFDISAAEISLDKNNFVYDGGSKMPTVTSVTMNGNTLTEGKDYTVVVSANKNIGNYKLTVNGIGCYCGTAQLNWSITN